jgi:hypothetical protein
MNDSELTLLVVQCGGSVQMTITPGRENENLYSFPSAEALRLFFERYKEKTCSGS